MENDLNIDPKTPGIEPQDDQPMVAQEDQVQPAEDEESTSPSTASKKWWIIGGVLLIFLASAAFLGARLLKPKTSEFGGGMGPSLMMSKGGGGSAKSVRLHLTPAKEVPQDKPAAAGLFVRREDQSIFIGTGNVQMRVMKPSSGGPSDVSSKYDGPVVEVVVTHETKVYQDITDMTPPDANSSGEVTLQQVVKPGSLDDLGANMMVSVWGDKQGDRYIAKVITFR